MFRAERYRCRDEPALTGTGTESKVHKVEDLDGVRGPMIGPTLGDASSVVVVAVETVNASYIYACSALRSIARINLQAHVL